MKENKAMFATNLSTKDQNTGYCIVETGNEVGDGDDGLNGTSLKTKDSQPKEDVKLVNSAMAVNDGDKVADDNTARKIRQIHEERNKQSSMIHEMVINKILSSGSGGSIRERRKRNRSHLVCSNCNGSCYHFQLITSFVQ